METVAKRKELAGDDKAAKAKKAQVSAKANKALQMKAKQRIPFQNGDLECMWQEFDIFPS